MGGAHPSLKTDRDLLMKDNLVQYCLKTFDCYWAMAWAASALPLNYDTHQQPPLLLSLIFLFSRGLLLIGNNCCVCLWFKAEHHHSIGSPIGGAHPSLKTDRARITSCSNLATCLCAFYLNALSGFCDIPSPLSNGQRRYSNTTAGYIVTYTYNMCISVAVTSSRDLGQRIHATVQ